jgi:multidrug efflux system membrane fusion protein
MRRRDLCVAALLSCLAVAGCNNTKASQKLTERPEVYYTHPTTDEVTDYEEFIGHTDAVNTVQVMARVTGYLDKVNFNDGDEVEKGALLFQIDDRPYKAEYDRAEATLEQGKARLTRLTADHNRAIILMDRNAIGREEFDRINGDYAEGKAAIGVYTAALERAKLDLDFTKVTAPLSGRLSRRMVDPGNLVKADETALTSIVSLDPMYVYFDVDERTMLGFRRLVAEGKIKSRQEAEIPVLVGLSDETDGSTSTFPHRGMINFSDNKVDSSTGTLRVRGVISNPRPRLFSPGLFVRIRLPIGTSRKSIMINEQAITSEQSNKSVFVIRRGKVKIPDRVDSKKMVEVEGDVAYSQPIKVGSLNKGMRAVEKGLAETDRVIISGLQRVRSGQLVTPIPQKKEKDEQKPAGQVAGSPEAPATSVATSTPVSATPVPPAPAPTK